MNTHQVELEKPSRYLKLPALILVGLCACSSPTARVRDVWSKRCERTVADTDKDLFLRDRASRIVTENRALPPAAQAEEFYATWVGPKVSRVRFEYRQLNLPDQVRIQEYTPAAGHRHMFVIRGDDYRTGGPVSAWRVSLWNEQQMLAEKKSALW